MKRMVRILGLFLLLAVVFSGCNTGKKLLEKGNYYEAVMQAIAKLANKGDSKKARETLATAYPLAVQTALNQIRRERELQSDFQHSETVYAYEDLNRLYEGVMSNPGARHVVRNPKDYYSQVAKERPKAAEEQYLAGLHQLEVGDRESAKRAFHYFEEAECFVKNYKDVITRKEEAYQLAILRVVVHLTPVNSRRYQLSASAFYDEVNKTFRKIERNPFIRFYTPRQAEKRNMKGADQHLVINFDDFMVGQSHTKQRVEKFEKDSVLVESTQPAEGRYQPKVYATVSAELTTNRVEVLSTGLVKLTITDGGFDKRIIVNQDFAGQFVWFSEWASYIGDKRALSKKQLKLCAKKELRSPPSQQMFVEFTRPILAQLDTKLTNFYKRY